MNFRWWCQPWDIVLMDPERFKKETHEILSMFRDNYIDQNEYRWAVSSRKVPCSDGCVGEEVAVFCLIKRDFGIFEVWITEKTTDIEMRKMIRQAENEINAWDIELDIVKQVMENKRDYREDL